MDTLLAQAIIDMQVPQFGSSLKNKNDSKSCKFDPRNLMSSPEVLRHIGHSLGNIARTRCSGSAIVGIATSGIAWASLASVYSNLPLLYIRKSIEQGVSDKLLEGIPPSDKKLILMDDLLFAGESKRKAIHLLRESGFTITDIVVVIDRELQRVENGPPLQTEFNLKLHSLITMSEIVAYMLQENAISKKQLADLMADYQSRERWEMPDFVKSAGQTKANN